MPSIILSHGTLAVNEMYTFSSLQKIIVWWVFRETYAKMELERREMGEKTYNRSWRMEYG